jgi:hypothetical protein
LAQTRRDGAVQAARQRMLCDPGAVSLRGRAGRSPGAVIASHKSASQPFHRLNFLARSRCLRADDAGMAPLIAQIVQQRSPEGPVPRCRCRHVWSSAQSGGPGRCATRRCWCTALIRFGLEGRPEVEAALAAPGRAGAREPLAMRRSRRRWRRFRRPGRREDRAVRPVWPRSRRSPSARRREEQRRPACTGAETLLALWADSRTPSATCSTWAQTSAGRKRRWRGYDLLHVLDVLSRFPWLAGDARLQDMLAVLRQKGDEAGRFTPESVWTAWKDWEFGQKRAPSRWLTLLCWRVIRRIEAASAGG